MLSSIAGEILSHYRLRRNSTPGEVVPSLLRLHQDVPGVRTGVFTTASDMAIDLVPDLGSGAVSVFRSSRISFPPYDADEIRGILRGRSVRR